jgi:hypothetical protein
VPQHHQGGVREVFTVHSAWITKFLTPRKSPPGEAGQFRRIKG